MPPRTRAKIVAIVAGAAALVVALLPVSFIITTDSSVEVASCGSAVIAAFHEESACRAGAPLHLIAAVVIAAAGAIVAVSLSKRDG
ncbi:hypothetical protein [Streptomyces sp. NPDC001970]